MNSRTLLNFWIDLASLLVLVGLVITGGVIHFVLPAGSGHWQTVLGLDRHGFGDIHFYLALAAIALLAVHLLLHWDWICCVVCRAGGQAAPSRRARTVAGVVLVLGLVLIVGGSLLGAASAVEQTGSPRGHRGEGGGGPPADPGPAIPAEPPEDPSGAEPHRGNPERHAEDCPAGLAISGRTTLTEAARICGLEVPRLQELLGLPAGLDPQERLGRLKRDHGLDLHAVRRLACRAGRGPG